MLDLLGDASADVRATAMRALVRVDPESFLSALASLDSDPDWRVRAAQAEALGKLSGGQGIPRLRSMLADNDARVIPAVLAALVAAKATDAERIIAERLKAADFAVRAAAANALADLKAVKSIPALAEAYRGARDDQTYVARAAALSALDRLDHQQARPVLTEALKDRDWAVRVRAAELLRGQGVTDVADAMRPAAIGRPVDDPEWQRIVAPPYAPKAYIDTTKGTIEVDLAIADAPLTIQNFVTLARKGFFNGLSDSPRRARFRRPGRRPARRRRGRSRLYDPGRNQSSGPYLRGTVGMALDWEDTGGSQFFITHSPQPHLDARYTVFGQVVTGMDHRRQPDAGRRDRAGAHLGWGEPAVGVMLRRRRALERPPLRVASGYRFLAAFFFAPFFAILNPPLHLVVSWISERVTVSGALCRLARRPGRCDPRVAGRLLNECACCHSTTGFRSTAHVAKQKGGAPTSTPKAFRRITASSRPSSLRLWQPSSPLCSPSGLATQPPTNHLAVTTGGLSHPPSYQM